MLTQSVPSKQPTGRRPTIGLLCSELSSDFITQLLWGTVDAVQKAGVNLLCFQGWVLQGPNIDLAPSNVLYELVSSHNVDGLLVMSNFLGTFSGQQELKTQLFDRYAPLPTVSLGLEMGDYPAILVDNYAGMYAAVTHLIEAHGYQRIAFVRGPHGHVEADVRFKAYQDALSAHGLPFDPALVATGTFMVASGEAAISTLLDVQHADCQAIVVANDWMAYGVLNALKARQLRVPYDMAVVGFDDIESARYAQPPLTTVRQPIYEMGQRAVNLVLDLLAGEDEHQVLLPTRLVVRRSCGCVSPAVAQAITGLVFPAGQDRCTLSEPQREGILSVMQEPLGRDVLPDEQAWLSELLDAFLKDLNIGKQTDFLATLDEILRQVSRIGHPLPAWGNVLSAMRRALLPRLATDQLLLAEDLWLPAQVMVSEMAQQSQKQQMTLLEQQMRGLNELQEALIVAFDIQEVMDTLARRLPRLGIPACTLSIYENPNLPATTSRLLLAYNEKLEQAITGDEQRVFPSQQLAPPGILPERPHCTIVEALYFHQEQLGFVLFEIGPRQGNVYETLRSEISSALQTVLLVQRIQERSDALARQQYILDTFMESVPDRIYFKDTQNRFTQVNKALVEKLGLHDASDLLGKSDFDFFPPEQAQEKYQQEQEILRTGQPLFSAEEPDGIDHWAVTTKMPLRDERGQIIGTFGISRDVTDLVRARQMAESAKDEAEKARQKAEVAQARAELSRQEAEAEKEKAETVNRTLASQMWQSTGQAQLNERMRGEQDIPALATNVVQQLCEYLPADSGALYIKNDRVLTLVGSYAHPIGIAAEIAVGEGLLGQAAVSKKPILRKNFSGNQRVLQTGLTQAALQNIVLMPLLYESDVVGVLELGVFEDFTPAQMEFLNQAIENITIAFLTAQARTRINALLLQTREQAAELGAQQEELRATNEELEAQTESLRASETRLREQQTALEAANAELEEKTVALQEKQAVLDHQNQELRAAQTELERRAAELAQASKYKSEFLANMSHELRTPLNSLLILARMLADNSDGNLTEEQVESAGIIHKSGADLLNLINEILDLSKVEAGRMEFHITPVALRDVVRNLQIQFEPIAAQKALPFTVTVDESLPAAIATDQQRVEQILKNLLANAFKFTEQGRVTLDILRPAAAPAANNLPTAQTIAFRVTDTGIGMTPEQQQRMFVAFQQADGSTSRKYGGTGLGLAISRELATRLGGTILLESAYGRGSVFTLYLPLTMEEASGRAGERAKGKEDSEAQGRGGAAGQGKATVVAPPSVQAPPAVTIPDDRETLQSGERAVLIIEDDASFAKIVRNFAHQKGFKCLVAGDGKSGLSLAATYLPAAIILDLNLPLMTGWEVLDALKGDPATRHIPVHIMSVDDEDYTAYQHGALGFLTKPVSPEALETAFAQLAHFTPEGIKSLLVGEDDANLRHSVTKLLAGADVHITEAGTGQAALTELHAQPYDCMILDLNLPDMTGFELLNHLREDTSLSRCPVIIYTGQALTEEENAELLRYTDAHARTPHVVVKGAKSPERLLDETALFLHRVVARMPEDKQQTIKRLHNRETVFANKRILLVDDDARNAFALSKLLSDKGIKVTIANSGQKALEMLVETEYHLVLMDIMMPDMDGYETIQRIRQQPQFRELPILALTAKAMKGDREKCIAAGANDYLPKPVDPERIFSMLRVWLYRV